MSWRDVARVAVVLVSAPLLVSCSEGYPGEDRPLVSPFDMSNAERVAELNVVGRDAPGPRWRYALREGCALEVEQGSGKDRRRVAVTLRRSMDAEVVFDNEAKTYDVALIDRSIDAARPIAILLKTDKWTYATQGSLLVDLLIRDCAKGTTAR
ncbi:hypothetical protein ACQ86G_12260 [Roseateles chitinivorans]|uniref:hypothetical protein n=1 Tax=Roseateles chitinivorans TaxID=2917965 RepID=UPI003D66B9C9